MEISTENGKTVIFTNFEETKEILFEKAKNALKKANVPPPYIAIQSPDY